MSWWSMLIGVLLCGMKVRCRLRSRPRWARRSRMSEWFSEGSRGRSKEEKKVQS